MRSFPATGRVNRSFDHLSPLVLLAMVVPLTACTMPAPAPEAVRAVRTLTVATEVGGGSVDYAAEATARSGIYQYGRTRTPRDDADAARAQLEQALAQASVQANQARYSTLIADAAALSLPSRPSWVPCSTPAPRYCVLPRMGRATQYLRYRRIRQRRIVMLLGFVAYFQLGQDGDPPFSFRATVVQAIWPGASAEQMAEQVTSKIERALQDVPFVDVQRSYTKPGESVTILQLKDSSPPSRFRQRAVPTWNAIVESAVRCFRPIVLTAAAAVLAMAPLSRSVFWGRWPWPSWADW
jgi:AcrB/AcrD/AcrF family